MTRRRAVRRLIACGLLTMAGAGCSTEPVESRLAREYFADNNTAARRGADAQQEFLRRTQHPDYTGQTCDLGDFTVSLDPALSTLRRTNEFNPDGNGKPRGDVWVVGVEVTTRHDGAVVGHQIGSQHLVFLDDRAYGFAPCPS